MSAVSAVSEFTEFTMEPQALAALPIALMESSRENLKESSEESLKKSPDVSSTAPVFESYRAARHNDALLRPFLEADGEGEAQRCLEVLIQRAAPLIARAVRQNRHVTPNRAGGRYERQEEQEADDIYQEALLFVIARLRGLRSGRVPAPIARYGAYVTATAAHVCHERLRRTAPNRQAFRARLRYLLTSVPTLALWRDDWGRTVCGLSNWQGRAASCSALLRLQTFQENPALLAAAAPAAEHSGEHSHEGRQGARSAETPFIGVGEWLWDGTLNAAGLTDLLTWLGGPVTPQHLTAALLGVLGVREPAVCASDENAFSEEDGQGDDLFARVPDVRADVAGQVEQRDFLRRLWSEVTLLPASQRVALLLNLRDTGGRGVLALLAHTRVATPGQIADALALSADSLAALWPALPMEDAGIAEILGVPRQQVINLRKSARARLARRLREQP